MVELGARDLGGVAEAAQRSTQRTDIPLSHLGGDMRRQRMRLGDGSEVLQGRVSLADFLEYLRLPLTRQRFAIPVPRVPAGGRRRPRPRGPIEHHCSGVAVQLGVYQPSGRSPGRPGPLKGAYPGCDCPAESPDQSGQERTDVHIITTLLGLYHYGAADVVADTRQPARSGIDPEPVTPSR